MSLALGVGLMLTSPAETTRDSFTSATMDLPVGASMPADQLRGSVAPAAVREPAMNAMFRQMCELKASDLHISATVAPLVRKDGEMRRKPVPLRRIVRSPLSIQPGEILPAQLGCHNQRAHRPGQSSLAISGSRSKPGLSRRA